MLAIVRAFSVAAIAISNLSFSSSSSDMSGYQAASTTADGGAMRIYPLSIAGATWFGVSSVATYGGGQQKAFPGGSYTAVVIAECVAQ